jgi:glycerophosphoryl diester phosphodiesterase
MPAATLGLLIIKGRKGALLRSELGRFIPHQALHPSWIDVTPALVRKNHRHGYRVYPYTVNEPIVMHDMLTAGVDGILTNNPPLALKVFTKMRERLPAINVTV